MKADIIPLLFAMSGEQTTPITNDNVIVSGLVRDAKSVSSRALDFITEMSCAHSVNVHVVGGPDIEELRSIYNTKVQEKYNLADCAPLDLVVEGADLSSTSRINRIEVLREFQRSDISAKIGSRLNNDSAAVVVTDFDLNDFPSPSKVLKHAREMNNHSSNVDVLCSAGVMGNDFDMYYDTFATVLLPDTFVYPVQDREVKEPWPTEDPAFILNDETFDARDLMTWLRNQGQSKDGEMSAVPVRSCFGGMAIYRASKYLDTRCSYSHDKNAIKNAKYRNDADKQVCEHVLWSNCMKSVDPNFVAAIQPDMTPVYHENFVSAESRHLQSNETYVSQEFFETPISGDCPASTGMIDAALEAIVAAVQVEEGVTKEGEVVGTQSNCGDARQRRLQTLTGTTTILAQIVFTSLVQGNLPAFTDVLEDLNSDAAKTTITAAIQTESTTPVTISDSTPIENPSAVPSPAPSTSQAPSKSPKKGKKKKGQKKMKKNKKDKKTHKPKKTKKPKNGKKTKDGKKKQKGTKKDKKEKKVKKEKEVKAGKDKKDDKEDKSEKKDNKEDKGEKKDKRKM